MAETPLSNSEKKLEASSYIINKRFRILEKLGKGGMGEIFLAEDVKLKRKVAIKKITSKDFPIESIKSRFLREAQTTSRIEHINICTIYEIYEEDEGDYIVMQYVDGVSLDQVVLYKKLRLEKVLDICLQICNGMMEAHSKKVIHRDLKPGNIMIDNRGIVKILDFGLAKMKDRTTALEEGIADTQMTEKGFVMGTVSYMSPEQVRGEALDIRTDIFSFGCVLFEMLEGAAPFHDTEQINILYNVLNREIKFKRKIPSKLRAIILRALAKDRERRYGSFAELRAELEDFRLSYLGVKSRKDRIHFQRLKSLVRKGGDWSKDHSSTGSENLDQLVLKLKNLDSGHHPATYDTTKRKKGKGLALFLALSILAAGIYFFMGPKFGFPGLKPDTPCYILLRNFSNESGEKTLPGMVNYLLYFSLNQASCVRTINENDVPVLNGSNDDTKLVEDFEERFPISYEISGKISSLNDIINLEVVLKPINSSGKSFSITVPGLQDHDSLLIHQIDTLSKKVFSLLKDVATEEIVDFKKISWAFGNSWEKFTVFYKGYEYYRLIEFSKALQYFGQVRDLLAAKLYLADMYSLVTFKIKAETLLNEITPEIDRLPEEFRLRTLSLKSRINFNFNEEINYLRKLKALVPYSKDVTFEIAESFFRHSLPKSAIPYYKETLRLKPDHSRAINHLAYCYSFLGRHEEAIELFEQYRDLDRTANSFDSLGDGYFYAGDYISAEACKRAAISLEDSGIFWIYQALANISILKAKYDEADRFLQQFEKAVDPSLAGARGYSLLKRSYISLLKKEFDLAINQIDESIRIFDSNGIDSACALSHWLKGLILIERGQLEKSRLELVWLKKFKDKFKLSVENYSTPFKYYLHLRALILDRDGKDRESEEVFKILVGLQERLSQASSYFNYQYFHSDYAAFLYRRQDYERALEEINHCLDFNPNYIPALWIKVDILEKTGNEGVKLIYQQIQDLYGDSVEKNAPRTRVASALSKK
jgi:serine/threonine protein kinase